MPLTTGRQKLFLVILGIGLSLLLLEVGLRLGGFLFARMQDRANQGDLGAGEFRILCIGESTTALGGEDSYPSQLETLLAQSYPDRKFRVINKGMVSKSSRDIFQYLPDFLENYTPHVVVAMIGVNDRHMLADAGDLGSQTRLILRQLRIFRFFELLIQHLYAKFEVKGFLGRSKQSSDQEPDVLARTDDRQTSGSRINRVLGNYVLLEQKLSQLQKQRSRMTPGEAAKKVEEMISLLKAQQNWLLVGLGRLFRLDGDYARALDVLGTALSREPRHVGALVELGRCYKEQRDCARAVPLFEAAHQLAPESVIPLLELMRCYEDLGQLPQAYRITQQILSLETDDVRVYPEIGQWFKEHEYDQAAVDTFLKGLELNPYDYEVYEQLADVYAAQGKTEEAEIYYLKAQQMEHQMVDYIPATIDYYNRIAEMIMQRGIRLICMQYPLREIAPLRDIFPEEYPIIFVSNKENFEKALAGNEYTAYFSDFFGGDFGHCTRAGNRLIAENLAAVISAQILGE